MGIMMLLGTSVYALDIKDGVYQIGTAADFALKLIENLIDSKKADEIAQSVVYSR